MALFSNKQLSFLLILCLHNSIIECSRPRSESDDSINLENLTSLNDSWGNKQANSSEEKTEKLYHLDTPMYEPVQSLGQSCKCVSCAICGCGCGALLGYVLSLCPKRNLTTAPSLSPIQAPSSSPIQAPGIFNPINQINSYTTSAHNLRLINQPKNSNPPFASLPDTTNVKAKTV